MLEPCEGKLSCTVLRGEGGSNTADLLDQIIENKQKFISQIMTSKSPVRSCEDIDETTLSYAEVKALATGNPYIREKMDLDIQVSKLKLLKANHISQHYRLEDNILKHYPAQIASLKEKVAGYHADIQTYTAYRPSSEEGFSMKIGNRIYTDKKEAGTALIDMCRSVKKSNMAVTIGEYHGFQMNFHFDSFFNKFTISLKCSLSHDVEIGVDALGNLQRLNHALKAMPIKLADIEQKLSNVERQLETARMEVTKPFLKEQELKEKLERLAELNALLNMDEKGDNAIDMDNTLEEENEKQEISVHDFQNSGREEDVDDKLEIKENTADVPISYLVENAGYNYAVENGNPQGLKLAAALTEKPVQRPSLKEKLAVFKAKTVETKKQEHHKEKWKDNTL